MLEARERASTRCGFSGRNCRITADSSTTGRTSTPASGCGTRKSPRSIPQSCSAASSPAAQYFEHSEISEPAHLHLRSRRLDLALGGYQHFPARLDAGNWLPAIPLGQLQRDDDDVSARAGIVHHPLPTDTWDAWKRVTFEYDGIRYIGSFAPLFVHQYSQAWFDFRDKRDTYADYFQNSILATEVHRRFCMDLSLAVSRLQRKPVGNHGVGFREGYVVWGGPPATGPIDGTVVPCAAGGRCHSCRATMQVLRTIKDRYPKCLEPLRIRGRVQSAHELVRHGCRRHRHGNHDADGGKRPHRIRVGNLHEESGSPARHGTRRIQTYEPQAAQR